MKKTKARVTYEVIFYHDDTWSSDELLQVAEDMTSPSEIPDGWTSEGIEDFHSECTFLELLEENE